MNINIAAFLKETSNVEVRDYQVDTISKAIKLFEAGTVKSVLVESPTGSGKTVIGLAAARLCQDFLDVKTVGWTAMRKNLLTQAQEENLKRNFGVNIIPISMFDKNPPKVDLLVVDEAHHDATESMATLHALCSPRFVIGLSATPFRQDRANLSFEKTIKEAGIYALVRDGYLAQFDHYTIPRWTPKAVTSTYLKDPSKWGKSVMFFHKEVHCREALDYLTEAGVKADVVTAKTDREAQLKAFQEGEIDVLINMLILTEGFDCPNLETVWVRPSAKGCTSQMCGRVLRKFEGLSKKVVQCQRTKNPFTGMAPSKNQFVMENGEWISLKPDEALNCIWKLMQKRIAMAVVDENVLKSLKNKSLRGRFGKRNRGEGDAPAPGAQVNPEIHAGSEVDVGLVKELKSKRAKVPKVAKEKAPRKRRELDEDNQTHSLEIKSSITTAA